jgi:hypothetical protein
LGDNLVKAGMVHQSLDVAKRDFNHRMLSKMPDPHDGESECANGTLSLVDIVKKITCNPHAIRDPGRKTRKSRLLSHSQAQVSSRATRGSFANPCLQQRASDVESLPGEQPWPEIVSVVGISPG